MKDKKPRELSLLFKVPKDSKIDGVSLGESGELVPTFQGRPIELSATETELSYSRKKGRKVLMRASTDPASPSIDINLPFLAFDALSALDTNTVEISSERVSIGCLVNCLRKRENGVVNITAVPASCLELRNIQGDPERVLWKVVLSAALQSTQNSQNLKIGIVVDSSLDSIRRINDRSEPVVDNWFLPGPFTLIYATSDSATATIGNSLIKECDKHATMVLRQIKKQPHLENLRIADPGEPFSHFRTWRWNAPVSQIELSP
jgi:hypothetical protein